MSQNNTASNSQPLALLIAARQGVSTGKRASGPSAFAVETSDNAKTGPVSATYASQHSCPRCPLRGGGCYAEFGPLAAHLRYVERASRRLARSTFYAMSRWQGKLERKQGFLSRIVDIGAELFAMSAVCVRARHDPSGAQLADLFCKQSRLRAEELFRALWENTDSLDVRAAKAVLGGRYAFLEEGVISPPSDEAWVAAWSPGPATVPDVRRRIPPVETPAPPS